MKENRLGNESKMRNFKTFFKRAHLSEAAALAAIRFDHVAEVLCDLGAVGVQVSAARVSAGRRGGRGCCCCCRLGGAGCSGSLGALHVDDSAADSAHLDAPLEADVALLAPAGAPGVLDEPVVGAALSAVANNNHRVVGLAAGATGEDAALVPLEGAVNIDPSHHGAVLGHQTLQSVLGAALCPVGAGEGGPLEEGRVGRGTGLPLAFVGIGGFT